MILAVQYHIEDRIDRNLSEEEIEIITVAYNNEFDTGMEKVFKSGESEGERNLIIIDEILNIFLQGK
ncbi:hypothetical protein [Bacillus cereus]|uniref:hypothetical protein n=2 Tax=Bacillus TaxID=1386 RepID=UPI000DE581EE|nr:hypothetical protein [Bacillus cereus]MDZ4643602.1 hypothetical protein [Bacillus cereus]HDR3326346.1 hypothetical protein [Bacillus thuringiensis]